MQEIELFFRSVMRLYSVDFEVFGYEFSFFDLLIATLLCSIGITIILKLMEI